MFTRTDAPGLIRRSIPRTLAGLTAAGWVLLAAGCAASSSNEKTSDGAVNSGLDGLRPGEASAPREPVTDPEEVARLLDESERLYNDLWSMGEGGGGARSRAERDAEADPEAVAVETADASLRALEPAGPPAPAEEAAAGPTPGERVEGLIRELAAAMREDPEADPYALAIRLAGLTAAGLSPAEAEAVIAGLPVDERETARAVLDLVLSLDADPERVADSFAERAERLNEARPIRISNTALCTRVEGFGRYNELPSTTFVAGSPMRMIVYTEVDHFDHAPIRAGSAADTDGADWEIRLSQELLLYHESDGLLAWRQPEEDTVYRARTRLRDFFMTNRADLPSSLTVGAYRLKVVVRDLADGSVDERIIPISVVADARLAGTP